MKTKKLSTFCICIIAFVVLVLILTEVGKAYLKDILREYENSQPQYVAEDFLGSNFNNGDYKAFAEVFSSQISSYETEEGIESFFEQMIAGKSFSLQSISTGLEDSLSYVVKCDNKKFATFEVVKSGGKTENGFDLYELSKIMLNEKLFKTVTVEAPLGYSVSINGVAANADNCLNDRIPTDSQGFMPEGVDGIYYTTYVFNNLLSDAKIEVASDKGIDTNVAENNGVFRAEIVYEPIPEDLKAYVIEATKAYACYLQKDANFGKVAKYLAKESQLYDSIRTSPNWMVIDHSSYEFENEEVTEFYSYGNDVISCRVTLVHVLKYPRLDDYREAVDITWYLKKVDGKFLIFNSFTN